MNFEVPQAEKFWRDKISKEIEDLMERVPEVNAYGVYLYIKDQNVTGYKGN